jgi:hypothetical protein
MWSYVLMGSSSGTGLSWGQGQQKTIVISIVYVLTALSEVFAEPALLCEHPTRLTEMLVSAGLEAFSHFTLIYTHSVNILKTVNASTE